MYTWYGLCSLLFSSKMKVKVIIICFQLLKIDHCIYHIIYMYLMGSVGRPDRSARTFAGKKSHLKFKFQPNP